MKILSRSDTRCVGRPVCVQTLHPDKATKSVAYVKMET